LEVSPGHLQSELRPSRRTHPPTHRTNTIAIKSAKLFRTILVRRLKRISP
jgi:hypothetical protein